MGGHQGPACRVGTPGGCQIGYMEHTVCHQLNRVLTAKQRGEKCQPYTLEGELAAHAAAADAKRGKAKQQLEAVQTFRAEMRDLVGLYKLNSGLYTTCIQLFHSLKGPGFNP